MTISRRPRPRRSRPPAKPPTVQVEGQEAFFIATPVLSFADRLRLMVHGRMIVAAEINTAKPALTELTFAIPTIEGVITSRPRSLAFANYKVRPA